VLRDAKAIMVDVVNIRSLAVLAVVAGCGSG
jgi:hypothetical protein